MVVGFLTRFASRTAFRSKITMFKLTRWFAGCTARFLAAGAVITPGEVCCSVVVEGSRAAYHRAIDLALQPPGSDDRPDIVVPLEWGSGLLEAALRRNEAWNHVADADGLRFIALGDLPEVDAGERYARVARCMCRCFLSVSVVSLWVKYISDAPVCDDR